jgi:hypothetical protein
VIRRRRREMHTGFWGETPKEGDYLEDLCLYRGKVLKWILDTRWKNADAFVWFRIRKIGRLL